MSYHFRTFGDMLKTLSEGIKPPERRSVSQSAEKFVYLREATHNGYFDNTIAPYLVDIMDEMESPFYNGVIFAGPARCGKSYAFNNWLAHSVMTDPGDMMVVDMTQATAREWSQGELRKFLRHSKKVGAKLMRGRQNLNTHDINFVNMRLLVKWPTITELSGKTLRRVWFKDYDRMEQDIAGEGPPFDLGQKRTQTFMRKAMTVAESSPGYEVTNHRWMPTSPHEAPPTLGILSLYNRGDRRRFYWRCADCRQPFEGDFKHLVYPDSEDMVEAAEMATMRCPHCGYDHTHDPGPGQPGKHELNQINLGNAQWVKDGQLWIPRQKNEAEVRGRLEGTARSAKIASFWLKGSAAAFMSWKEIVYNYLKAWEDYEKNLDMGPLKKTVNTDQGNPFTPPILVGDRLPEHLKARAKDIGEKVVPDGIRFLTSSIDVQKSMFIVQVHGHSADNSITVIDRFRIKKSKRLDEDGHPYPLAPHAYEEDWHVLVEQVIEKTYPLADGSDRRMRIKAIACDSGGREGVTPRAYAFWRWLRDEHPANHHSRFQLIKGNPQRTAPRTALSYPDSDRKDRHAGARGEVPVLLLNVDMLKDQLDGMLDRIDGQSSSVYFPKWLPDWFFTELTVEVKVPNKGWENPKKLRNEAWDLLVYCIGICLTNRHIGIERIDWENPPSWAALWDDNDMVFSMKEGLPFATEGQDEGIDFAALAAKLG
ncbi:MULTISPECIES: terminase gpA endonuclease subunit [Brucella/Ochrobactrum group]|jgi:phage terminase large subunit GpA-like protein|uniref:terminase gpA endonuclease subunit n=1 Tax=Ochrobactrum sp. BTU2 TaxID=2856166 RepID=UPI00211A7027|nr:terminase gpA endonuclease subunit [Ochrobactrum sp. BTU2]MCQ9146038.1 phage terminase large subunit family protein [Ochrobactrum sp. BTU2]